MAGEMNFRFLRELQKKERENAELQKLPDDFLEQLKKYIKRKVDLLSRPEMLTFTEKKEIENLKPVIKYIFDKREQKVVIAALRSARTGIKPKNMLPHEEVLFNALKTEIVKNRLLLEDILMMIDPAYRSANFIEFDDNERVAGSNDSEKDDVKSHVEEKGEKLEDDNEKEDIEVKGEKNANDVRDETREEVVRKKGGGDESPAEQGEMIKVEITKDVPAFIGIDLNKYGPWKKGQAIMLPEKIARALMKTGRAREIQK